MIKSGDPVVSSSEQFFWHVIPVSCICLVKGFIISSLILARSSSNSCSSDKDAHPTAGGALGKLLPSVGFLRPGWNEEKNFKPTGSNKKNGPSPEFSRPYVNYYIHLRVKHGLRSYTMIVTTVKFLGCRRYTQRCVISAHAFKNTKRSRVGIA